MSEVERMRALATGARSSSAHRAEPSEQSGTVSEVERMRALATGARSSSAHRAEPSEQSGTVSEVERMRALAKGARSGAPADRGTLTDRLAALSPGQRTALLRILATDEGSETQATWTTGGPTEAEGEGAHVADPRREHADLSYGQQRMWFLNRLDPASPVHNTITQVPLPSPPDLAALRWATNEVIARHAPLRTRYLTVDDDPLAEIDPIVEVDVEIDPDPTEFVRRPFDLATGPVVRVCALRDRSLALVCVHHIATDGWSMRNFVRELAQLYRARVERSVARLPQLTAAYSDFTDWQRSTLTGPNLEQLQTFWRLELADLEPLELLTDRPRPDAPQFRGDAVAVEFPAAAVNALRELARESGATMFMAVLAVYATLLGQWSGQSDFAVGTPVAGRSRSEFEPLIGLFVNTLVVRCDTSGDVTFRQLLGRVKDAAVRAYAHQELPFQLLVEGLGVPRDLTRNPLVQAMLRVETVAPRGHGGLSSPHASVSPFATLGWDRGTSELDVSLDLWDAAGTLSGRLEFSAELFDRGTAERMAGELIRVTTAVAAAPDSRLALVTGAGEADRAALRRWNSTSVPLPDRPVHELIDARAATAPDAFAVGDLTYRQLVSRANLLAHHLVSHGVRPGAVVALTMPRGADLIVAMLGSWKAGAAYLCLDPADPPARRATLLAAVRPAATLDSLPELRASDPAVADAGQPPDVVSDPDSLAYVVFTSGTTGDPKGVRIGHHGLANHCMGFVRAAGLGPADRVLQFAPPVFDVAAEEIFPTLITGGTVVPVAGDHVPGIAELRELLTREQISVANLPAGYWHEWAAAVDRAGTGVPQSLRLVVVGSERVDVGLVERWRAAVGDRPALLHAYGVSEATITSLVHPLDGGPIVLGRPLPNVRARVVDRHGGDLPIGCPGELEISGPGVALGYLDRPDLDAAAFGTGGGEPCYRTGDRARWRSDGTIEFLGRLDRQIKVDGRRVEPGGIESMCSGRPGVQTAAVGLVDARLVCAVVGTVTAAELTDYLRERLPPALVPSVHLVEKLPRNANGKVDLTLLRPRPTNRRAGMRSAGVVERQIRDVWRAVLTLDEVGLDDNFFDLGGRSLLLVRVQARLAARGIEASMLDLFRWPTIRMLAAHLPGDRR